MEKIHEKIKKLRILKNISQTKMAEIVGISRATYVFIENGTTENISIEVGKNIAKALGVSFNELFEIENQDSNVKELEEKIKEFEKTEDLLFKENASLKLWLQDKNQLNESLRKEIFDLKKKWKKDSLYFLVNEYIELRNKKNDFAKWRIPILFNEIKTSLIDAKENGILTEKEIISSLYIRPIISQNKFNTKAEYIKAIFNFMNEFIPVEYSNVENHILTYHKTKWDEAMTREETLEWIRSNPPL